MVAETNVRAMARRDEPQGGAMVSAAWDHEQTRVIKELICPGASDAELSLFGQVCQRTGLDPFSRQIYGIMRPQRQQINGEWQTISKLSIQTSIDGFRLIAERSGKYGGQLGPQWCGADGVWHDVWLAQEYPAAARVGVIRVDWREPLWAAARWDSYVQTHRDKKTQQDVVGSMWQRMPDVMLAKVAESLALRRAFPAELSGLYTSEEMQQADRDRADTPQREIVTNDQTTMRERQAARRVVAEDGTVLKENEPGEVYDLPLTCKDCQGHIKGARFQDGSILEPKDVASRSQERYGRALCMPCSRKAAKAERDQQAQAGAYLMQEPEAAQ